MPPTAEAKAGAEGAAASLKAAKRARRRARKREEKKSGKENAVKAEPEDKGEAMEGDDAAEPEEVEYVAEEMVRRCRRRAPLHPPDVRAADRRSAADDVLGHHQGLQEQERGRPGGAKWRRGWRTRAPIPARAQERKPTIRDADQIAQTVADALDGKEGVRRGAIAGSEGRRGPG
jgi:hypothetical protein